MIDYKTAANRFGFGAKIDEQQPQNPKRWLENQLKRSPNIAKRLAKYPSTRELIEEQQKANGKEARKKLKQQRKQQHKQEIIDRLIHAFATPTPFYERLVWFVSNVLTISSERPTCVGLIGSFERDVIRKNLSLGYDKILINSAKHPAMLLYLDNINSIGPDSKKGRRRSKGRNENYAREILELHTVGLEAKYTQQDVISLTNILTGWTIAKKKSANRGFYFNANTHQPGPQTLLGVKYSQSGVKQGEAALRDLAKHPFTAKNLATKMANHFISENPPVELVDQMAKAYLNNGSSILKMAHAMILSPLSWQPEQQKIKTPIEIVVSTMRLLIPSSKSFDTKARKQLLNQCQQMGQRPYAAQSPKGWSDLGMDWLGGEAMLRRLKWAEMMSRKFGKNIDNPTKFAQKHFNLSTRTKNSIARAPDRETAIGLLLASPEFQRR